MDGSDFFQITDELLPVTAVIHKRLVRTARSASVPFSRLRLAREAAQWSPTVRCFQLEVGGRHCAPRQVSPPLVDCFLYFNVFPLDVSD